MNPELPVSVWGSPVEVWINSGLPWGQGHWQQQSWEVEAHVGMSPLGSCQKPYHTAFRLQDWWPQTIQLTRREHSPTYQHRVRLKFYWSWPCPPEQDPVFPTASLSYQEACTSLFSSSIRGQREEVRTTVLRSPDENHSHRKLTNMITWIRVLCNSVKL